MRARLSALVLATAMLVAAAPTGSDGTPDGYAARLPIVVASGAPAQRIMLPAAVLAASRTAGLSDLRVFDAANRAMPIAQAAAPGRAGRRDVLPAMPILGAADALTVTGVSLTVEGTGDARVTRIDGTPRGGPAEVETLGALLDARAVRGDAEALSLDADVPQAQPVTFTVAASADLKTWRPIAEKTVYRATGATGGPRIPLDGEMLHGQYLRITWHAASRLLAPVTVRGAVLESRAGAAAPVTMGAILPDLADPHVVEFAIPFATALDTIELRPTGNDAIVPVRVLGRNDAEQPWTLLGRGTAVRPGVGANAGGAITLPGQSYRLIRIEADQRSAGFTSPPGVELGFVPRAIVFLTAGRPPFTLAVGRAGAADVYLPPDNVATDRGPIPTATVTTAETPLRLAAIAGTGTRQALLWIVLLAATAMLGGMAWALWKRNGRVDPVA
ncbi:DUF3999 family protein [Sphingomonas sp. R86521]|uniref:DUF3999 family protein n=1 Tax=Sphingomonas sp. R86521 TaxID=3093860 RepID=UPI0036D434CB